MPSSDPETAALAVELFVPDVAEAVRFYTDKLGFRLLRLDPEGSSAPVFAIGTLAGATFMFMDEGSYAGDRDRLMATRGEGVDIRVMVADVDAIYRAARQAGVEVVHDIADRYYGLRDFIMRDPNGFRLRFASPLG